MPEYSVLIRTFNCEHTLAATLESLRKQTCPPSEYIIVDSGSTDGTVRLLPPGAVLERFAGAGFNYSAALNQGIARVSRPYVLTISSHTELQHPRAAEYALQLLAANDRLGAAYFSDHYIGPDAGLTHQVIDRSNFDGFNGLWNTCSLIKVPLLRKRGFRPEVFAAEDQEWAGWLFRDEDKAIACIAGGGMRVNNPRKLSTVKRLNEYVAIACYAQPALLGWRNLARIARKALGHGNAVDREERRFNRSLLLRLLSCKLMRPRAKSGYL